MYLVLDFGHVVSGNMFHYIYKITNKINNKYYIGRHSTKILKDYYFGSGIGISNAVKKYGRKNFKFEIIAQAKTTEDLWELEKQIVNEKIKKDRMSYNQTYGGKSYLDGLKKYNPIKFKEHQKKAGLKGGQSTKKIRTKEWHRKGQKNSSRNRAEKYIYKITTNKNEEYIVNGYEFKKICKEKKWNYNTLCWRKSLGKFITRGKLKSFKVDLIKKPYKN